MFQSLGAEAEECLKSKLFWVKNHLNKIDFHLKTAFWPPVFHRHWKLCFQVIQIRTGSPLYVWRDEHGPTQQVHGLWINVNLVFHSHLQNTQTQGHRSAGLVYHPVQGLQQRFYQIQLYALKQISITGLKILNTKPSTHLPPNVKTELGPEGAICLK